MTKLKLFSLIVLVSFLNVCVSAVSTPEKDNTVSLSGSSVNPLGEFAHWAEYHKQSGRLDNILGKCYECIRDRSLGESRLFFLKLNNYLLLIKLQKKNLNRG